MSSSFSLTFLDDLFWQLLRSSPTLLVYSIGMALAVVYRRRCPRAMTILLLGCGVLFVNSVGWMLTYRLAISYLQSVGTMDSEQMFLVLNLAHSLTSGLGIALLIAAALAGRRDFERAPAPQQFAD